MNDIPENLTPEEKWTTEERWHPQRTRFLAIVQRILNDPPRIVRTEPYAPSEKDIPPGPFILWLTGRKGRT